MVAATPTRVPVQARALRTREALLEAAQREFETRGYAQTTARSIAERAGVATGSFYQYFPDKDAALRTLAAQRMDALATAIAELERQPRKSRDPKAAVLATIDLVIDYHRESPGLHAVLTERRHADPELDRLTAASEARFVQHVERVLAKASRVGDREATAFVLFGLIEGAVHAHVLGAARVSDKRFRAALCDAVIAVAVSHRA
jgi:AcrR family transcriptional regulator